MDTATKQRITRFAKCDPAWLKLQLAGRELRVLLGLSLHADWRPAGLGRCYPKRDTLALTTGMQVSNVSEAIRELAKERLITVVRLGRKNIYYVRPMGSTDPMPPSDPDRFFEYLQHKGIRFNLGSDGKLFYAQNSPHLDPLERGIFSDYLNGLVPRKSSAMLSMVLIGGGA